MSQFCKLKYFKFIYFVFEEVIITSNYNFE